MIDSIRFPMGPLVIAVTKNPEGGWDGQVESHPDLCDWARDVDSLIRQMRVMLKDHLPVYRVAPPDRDVPIITTSNWDEAVNEARFYRCSTIAEYINGQLVAYLDVP